MLRQCIAALALIAITLIPAFAHGDATHITGTITAIEGDHIQLKDLAGKPVMVMLAKTTKYLKSEKPATRADLKVGTRVLIDARMDEKMKMFAAEEITIGVTATPAEKPATPKAGTAAKSGK